MMTGLFLFRAFGLILATVAGTSGAAVGMSAEMMAKTKPDKQHDE
jgi:hypothetical protein